MIPKSQMCPRPNKRKAENRLMYQKPSQNTKVYSHPPVPMQTKGKEIRKIIIAVKEIGM